MSRGYVEMLGNISPTARGARRAADIVAALAPPSGDIVGAAMTKSGTAAVVKTPDRAPAGSSITQHLKGWAPGLVGAGVGFYSWKRHRFLGAVGGHALGSCAAALYRGDDKTKVLCDLGVEAAGIFGALRYRKMPLVKRAGVMAGPILGFVGGSVLGAAVTAFVPGSSARQTYDHWKAGR